MEPVISPWIIYIASVCLKISQAAYAIAIFSLSTIAMLTFIALIVTDGYGIRKEILKWVKRISYVTVIAGLLYILIPGEETILAMLTAHYVTSDNIQAVQGNIVDFIKQISDAMNNGVK